MANGEMLTVLIVDDDDRFRHAIVHRFRTKGFDVHEAGDAETAGGLISRHEFQVVVLDIVLPGNSGVGLLGELKRNGAECEVIVLTGQTDVESAVAAMKMGAYDYLRKPFPLGDLENIIQKAARQRRLSNENKQLRAVLQRNRPPRKLIGQSPAMQEVLRLIERAGPSDKPILIQGESGTGKELVAWALHECSDRAARPMVVTNCAAVPESWLESELFGHERGAFPEADSAQPGLFEVADGGTIFIDEIGEIPPSVQVKLLRVLEDGSLRRTGSIRERRVQARLLAATNRNLERALELGQFRHDLFYRINLMSLELPPLRERREDIEPLIEYYLPRGWTVEPRTLARLKTYHWPGNVRQLINVLERAQILSDDQVVRWEHLPRRVQQDSQSMTPAGERERDQLAALERAKVLEVLRREEGNKSRAARTLGIDRRKLYRLLEKYEIEDSELAESAPPDAWQA